MNLLVSKPRYLRLGVLFGVVLLYGHIPAFCQAGQGGGEGGGSSSKEILWSVSPPPEKWVLLYNQRVPLTISTGTKKIDNVRILSATLQESTNNALLKPDCLHLVHRSAVKSKSTTPVRLDLDAGKLYPLALQIDAACVKEGTFQGMVSLTSDTKPEEKIFKLTVLSTSTRARVIGGCMIALGIGLSWLVTVFLRNRALRAETLIPAVELRVAVRKITRGLQDLQGSTTTQLTTAIGQLVRIENDLSDKSLEDNSYIPRGIPNPFKALTDRAADYRAFLTERSREISLLEEVHAGMRKAFESWSVSAGAPVAVRTALGSMDAAAQALSSPDSVRQKILDALTTLGRTLALGGGVVSLSTGPSPVELRVELHRLSLATWILWGAVTWTLGYMALIATNYGFGVGLDYFKCFFWGLGLQVAGQQLQQFTPSSISNVFSLSFPKA